MVACEPIVQQMMWIVSSGFVPEFLGYWMAFANLEVIHHIMDLGLPSLQPLSSVHSVCCIGYGV